MQIQMLWLNQISLYRFLIIILSAAIAVNGEQAAKYTMALPIKMFIRMLIYGIIQTMAT
jgi:hypothetical protein